MLQCAVRGFLQCMHDGAIYLIKSTFMTILSFYGFALVGRREFCCVFFFMCSNPLPPSSFPHTHTHTYTFHFPLANTLSLCLSHSFSLCQSIYLSLSFPFSPYSLFLYLSLLSIPVTFYLSLSFFLSLLRSIFLFPSFSLKLYVI